MRLYLSPTSSLELMRYLRAVNGPAGLEGVSVRKRVLNDAINTVRAVDELDGAAQLLLGQLTEPIHAFVATREAGTSTERLVTHVLSQPVPNGALLDIGHGICICTPQFAFMRLSTQKDLVELVSVGMELCGTYTRWNASANSVKLRFGYEQARGCTFRLPPAMQAYRARTFVGRMDGQRGVFSARAALKWLADGSASPMETAVYLLLCLPKRLGGYGFPQPLLNPKLTINTPDGRKNRYPDLFWPGPDIDVEYNSDEDHSGEWSRYRDSRREIELTVANVRVLPLTRQQLMDARGFDEFAQGLRRMLGIRARKADGAWECRHGELRRRLLAAWSV